MSGSKKQFIDSGGQIGRPKVSTSRKVGLSRKPENIVSFEVVSTKHLRLKIPGRKDIMVTKENAIRLAHWLLDTCSISLMK